jgi:hypothetical protein
LQLYALEIVGALLLCLGAFFLYRFLVNSKSFNEFVEGTKPTLTADEIEANLDRGISIADKFVAEEQASIQKKARNVKRVKTRLGE